MATDSSRSLTIKVFVIIGLIACAVLAWWQLGIPLGLDLRGGTELLYRIRYEEVPPDQRQNLATDTLDIIRRRIDPQGILEPVIAQRGKWSFYVQIPGLRPEDAKRIETRMQTSGKLEFALVDDNPDRLRSALAGRLVRGREAYVRRAGDKHWVRVAFHQLKTLGEEVKAADAKLDFLLVDKDPIVTGKYLNTRSVGPTTDETGRPAVAFAFLGAGRAAFTRATERNPGKRLAIILDDALYSAPVIRERIAGNGIISGDFSREEQTDLIAILKAGSLPAGIQLEWKHSVGPELGRDSIVAGTRAAIAGIIIVVAFIAVYYLAIGLVADFALFFNMLLILGTLALFRAVLTLPGIAGLILTVGMAVDANVLIFERIREERARGKTARLALKNGFERAFTTILDANLTTLITAFILYGIGVGPIRGFAVVLSIGIISSMFAALFTSRVVLDVLLSANILHDFRMLQFFKRPHLPFSRVRHVAMAGSLALIIAGLTVFISRGQAKYDNDFTGGFMAEMVLAKPLQVEQFRRRVAQAGYPDANIQTVGTTAEGARDVSRTFTVRVKAPSRTRQEAKLERDLADAFGGAAAATVAAVADQPWSFRVTLKTPASAPQAWQMLAQAGYRESSVDSLVFPDLASRDYELRLRGRIGNEDLTETDIADAAEGIRKALWDWVAVRQAGFAAGDIETVPAPATAPNAPRRLSLNVTLQGEKAARVEAIRAALVQQVLGGKAPAYFDVTGTGADSGAVICREIRIISDDRAPLAAIKAAAATATLDIASFYRDGDTLHAGLTEPRTEPKLRGRLDEKDLAKYIAAIVPMQGEDKDFTVAMQSYNQGARGLDDSKILEMIEDDLRTEFAPELKGEETIATVTPLPDASAVPDAAELKRQGFSFYRLELKSPDGKPRLLDAQTIEQTLDDAGAGAALVGEHKVSSESLSQAVIKLKGTAQEIQTIEDGVRKAFAEPRPFRRLESFGETVARELKSRAYLAILAALVAIIFYIWLRFGEAKFGIAAIVALAHDVAITMGAVAAADLLSETAFGRALGFSNIKINIPMVAAFLTIVGYSLNDTIVVFDRIRENLGGGHRRLDPGLIDNSVNQTLSRTILTSATTLVVCLCLYVLGGPVIHGFAFALTIGVIVGTYSSIFIASPILVDWEAITGFLRGAFRVVTLRSLRS